MDAKERIEKVLEMYSLNAKTLSERIGLDRPQALYDILNGKTKNITEKMAFKIISAFPNIQKVWLLTGEGNVLYRAELAPEVDASRLKEDVAQEEKSTAQLLEVIADQQKTIKYLREKLEAVEAKREGGGPKPSTPFNAMGCYKELVYGCAESTTGTPSW